MENELKKQAEQIENLREQLALFLQQNEQLRSQNKKLTDQVSYLIRQLFGRKSETLDPNQMLLLLGLDELLAEDSDNNNDDEPPPADNDHAKKRKRRQLKDRLPEDLPVRTEIIDPPEVLQTPDDYECIGEETLTELSMTQPVYFQKKTVRRKYVKKSERSLPPVIVPAEPRLIDNSFASVELIVDIIIKKYCDHLPFYRQAQILQRYGIELSHKTMSGWMWHIGNWLNPVYQEMKEELRASGYLQVDETCIRYLVPGSGKSHSGYLWVYHAPGLGVLFDWHTGRSALCLENILEGYAGDLQCDGYQAYRTFQSQQAEDLRCRLFACWAHARRYFFNAKDESICSAEVLREIKALYEIETQLRQSGATHEQRKSCRDKEAKPILEKLKSVLDGNVAKHLPQSLTGKAISYTLNLWDELVKYADTGHVEIDNNLVENAIRPSAIGKKNWLFFGSANSGQTSAVIYSILETCRKLDINPNEYITDVLSRLPTLTAKQARDLTPSKWAAKQARAAA